MTTAGRFDVHAEQVAERFVTGNSYVGRLAAAILDLVHLARENELEWCALEAERREYVALAQMIRQRKAER